MKMSVKSFSNEKEDTKYTKSNSSLPSKIINGIGVIIKLLPEYGFIKVKEPIKTSVFFNMSHFGYKQDTNLIECGLTVGTMVYFNAKCNKMSSKYCATKVWKKDDDEENVVQQPKRKVKTGLYDPLNLEGEGIIQNVFPNVGFIAVDGNENNSVFFHKRRLVNYDNVVDLTKVLKKGDLMEFSAHRSTKSDVKARWEATKVWKKSKKNLRGKNNDKPDTCTSDSGSNGNQSPFQSDKNSAKSVMKDQLASSPNEIKNQHGKIYPRSHGAVIKFGENLLADGDSSIYYICGTQVNDISWEFGEGDDVMFDAVKIKSAPGWKATLVWVADKPNIDVPNCLVDSSQLTDEEFDETLEDNSDGNASVSSNILPFSSNSSLKSESLVSESWSVKGNIKKENATNLIDRKVNESSFEENEILNLCASSRSSSQNSLLSSDTRSTNGNSKKENATSFFHLKVKESGYKGNNVNSLCASSRTCSQNSLLSTESMNNNHSLLKKNDENLIDKNGGKPNYRENNVPVCSSPKKNSKNSLLPSSKSSKELIEKSDAREFDCKERNLIKKEDDDYFSVDECSKSSKENTSDVVTLQHNENCTTENQDDDLKIVLEYLQSVEKDVSNKKQFKKTDPLKKSENVELNSKCLSDNSERKTSKKIFQNIAGKILKVYSKYAEIESFHLLKPIGFFWDIFYYNKSSIEELELSSLKEILTVGDTVSFNYFEIIDDSHQSWKVVSMVWKGPKPLISAKLAELTPEDFIKQNSLSVTIKEEEFINDTQTVAVPSKKFLTAYEDINVDSESGDGILQTESYSDYGEIISSEKCPEMSEQQIQSSMDSDLQTLPDMICEILRKNELFVTDSWVDLNSVSAELLNAILEHYKANESNDGLLRETFMAKSNEKETSAICSICGENWRENFCEQNISTKDVKVQTIVTGEIMAQNIFTEC